MDESQEDRLTRVEYAIWGLRGNNGMIGDLKDFRKEFEDFMDKEAKRREGEATAQRVRDRNLVVAALGVMASLVAVIVVLVLAVHG
jgi:hypothetical protein